MKEHGTTARYRIGCRCDECREAQRVSRKASRDRARARNSPGYQRELATARRLKQSYRGTCQLCGKPTNGSAGPGKAPTRCVQCSLKILGEQRRGQGPRIQQLRDCLADGPKRYSEIQRVLGVSKDRMSTLIWRAVKFGVIERVERGLYKLPQDPGL